MRISSKQYAKVLLELVLENPKKEKEIVKKFAFLLNEKGVVSLLPAIIEHFERLWDEHFKVSKVEITSARPLSKEVLQLLEKEAISLSGFKQIEVVKKIDPKIIGGAILRYGDKILDISLYTKLEHLKNILKG